MNTAIIPPDLLFYKITGISLPLTARGRALYTTDYFLNGTPIYQSHDNTQLTVKNVGIDLASYRYDFSKV